MTWMAPRTWTDGEVVTETMLNMHVRDNFDVIKTARNDIGRIAALTSAEVADLDGTSLTGLANPGVDNSFTGGRHRFQGSAKLQIPVGTNKYPTDGGGAVPGSIWVDGDYLHHVDPFRQEWRYLGTVISSPAAQPGFLFIVGNALRYTDESGQIRECVSSASAYHTDSAARAGSLWVGANYATWIRETGSQAYVGHADVVHADHSDHGDHTDHHDAGSPHGDVAHTDHAAAHVDHGDGPGHGDHSDHGDVAHSDHTDHTDTTTHSDATPHGDVAADSRPEEVTGA